MWGTRVVCARPEKNCFLLPFLDLGRGQVSLNLNSGELEVKPGVDRKDLRVAPLLRAPFMLLAV